jgi:hypothetical protein
VKESEEKPEQEFANYYYLKKKKKLKSNNFMNKYMLTHTHYSELANIVIAISQEP